MIDETAEWFALQVKPRRESAVSAGLAEKGIENLAPLYTERRRWSDRLKTTRAPLFPGYVFCRLNRSLRTTALRTPGVIRVVGFGRRDQALDVDEIEGLRTLMRPDIEARRCLYLNVGQRVRITEGPFAGLSGLLTQVRGERRLVVSLGLLQRSAEVEIGAASLEPMTSPWPGARSA